MIQDDDLQDGTFPHLEVPILGPPGMDVQLTEISQGGFNRYLRRGKSIVTIKTFPW